MYLTKFLEFKTRRYIRKNDTKRYTTDYSQAKKIGVIFSAEGIEKHRAIKALVKSFKSEGKEVSVLSFLGPGKQNHEFLFDIISANDISFWGSIKSENVREFANESFDYLLDLDNTSNVILENILALSKAKCRVGIYKKDKDSFFEMMINPRNPNSELDLIDDIRHYTRKIIVYDD